MTSSKKLQGLEYTSELALLTNPKPKPNLSEVYSVALFQCLSNQDFLIFVWKLLANIFKDHQKNSRRVENSKFHEYVQDYLTLANDHKLLSSSTTLPLRKREFLYFYNMIHSLIHSFFSKQAMCQPLLSNHTKLLFRLNVGPKACWETLLYWKERQLNKVSIRYKVEAHKDNQNSETNSEIKDDLFEVYQDCILGDLKIPFSSSDKFVIKGPKSANKRNSREKRPKRGTKIIYCPKKQETERKPEVDPISIYETSNFVISEDSEIYNSNIIVDNAFPFVPEDPKVVCNSKPNETSKNFIPDYKILPFTPGTLNQGKLQGVRSVDTFFKSLEEKNLASKKPKETLFGGQINPRTNKHEGLSKATLIFQDLERLGGINMFCAKQNVDEPQRKKKSTDKNKKNKDKEELRLWDKINIYGKLKNS